MDSIDELIVHFCDVTGATPEQANTFLQVSDGNVEAAIGLFLESGGTLDWNNSNNASHPPTGSTAPASSADITNTRGTGNVVDLTGDNELSGGVGDEIRPPLMSRQRDVLIGDSGDLFMEGIGLGHGHSHSSNNDPFGRSPIMPSSGGGDDGNNRLARLFAPPRDIMYSGGFDEAREYARQNSRWMIVTLHDPTEFPCQVLNRDLWKDDSIKELIKASFVFLQFVIDTPEGQRYRNFYPVDSLPHIAIIDPRTGERVKIWHHGPAPSDLMVDLMDFLESNSLDMKKRSNAPKKQREMTEDEQIAAALAESIKTSPPASNDSIDGQVAGNSSTTSKPQQSISSSIVPNERSEIPAGTDGTTSIQFRLPDGKRVVRKFLKSDTVQALFQHVKFAVPDLQSKPFELMFHRDTLGKSLDKTLQEMNLTAAAINVDYL